MPDSAIRQTCELLIVGGGPAGLAAALVAARAQRRVVLVDSGEPRNLAAPAIRGYLTRDGVEPGEFRRLAHEQLNAYPTCERVDGEVMAVEGDSNAFVARLSNGARVSARRVLLATGLVDILPEVEGLQERWGRGVFHCPYCDGYERRGQHWGVIGNKPSTIEFAMFLRGWTQQVTLFTLGHALHGEAVEKLHTMGVAIEVTPIARVIGSSGEHLEAVALEDGRRLATESLWVRPAQRQHQLTVALGVTIDDDGCVIRDRGGETSTPGMFVAGDLAGGSVQQALQAAADGARVAMTINHQLIIDERGVEPRTDVTDR